MTRILRAATFCILCCLLTPAQAKRAPNLMFNDLDGKRHKIAELRGSIVVFNFWATWCAPCRDELPLLSTLTGRYAGKNVRFISASADEAKNRKKVDEFLSRNPLAMDVWVGADVDMMEVAGLENVLPATMILDEQGEVIARVEGQAREEDITGALEWLLGGRSGTPPQAVTKRY